MINKLSILIILAVGAYYVYQYGSFGDINCQNLDTPPPAINFIDKENEIVYDLKVSKNNLARLKENHEQRYSQYVRFDDTLGLTLATYDYKLHLTTGYKRKGLIDAKYCPYIREVNIDFVYTSKVYVAKEYAGNKCAFRVILNHELDHHETNVRNKQKYLKWLKKDLPAVINKISEDYGPIPEGEVQAFGDKIPQDIEKVLNVYFNKMHANTKIDNDKLDTLAEYKRLNHEIALCYRR